MEEKDKIVMVKVTWEIREKLKAKGKKGDTYDDVIRGMFSDLETRYPQEDMR
jgi:hypothetical protein